MNPTTRIKSCFYVAWDAATSVQAIASLREICRTQSPDGHEIQIVDVLRQPKPVLHLFGTGKVAA